MKIIIKLALIEKRRLDGAVYSTNDKICKHFYRVSL